MLNSRDWTLIVSCVLLAATSYLNYYALQSLALDFLGPHSFQATIMFQLGARLIIPLAWLTLIGLYLLAIHRNWIKSWLRTFGFLASAFIGAVLLFYLGLMNTSVQIDAIPTIEGIDNIIAVDSIGFEWDVATGILVGAIVSLLYFRWKK